MPEEIEIGGQPYKAVCAMRPSGERHVIYLPRDVADQSDAMQTLNLLYCGRYDAEES